MALLDSKVNFGLSTVLAYYGATETQIVVDNGARLGTPPYDLVWYDDKNYPGNPAIDPNVEIVRVTSRNGNTLTLENSGGNRVAQQGTTASTKNTVGGIYKVIAGVTKKDFDDLEALAIDVGTAYCWITEHGAVGDGVTDDRAAFAAAIAAGRTYIVCPAGTYKIGSNLTIGSTIALEMLPGALLSPSAGVTLTIQGDICAGNWQIFTGSGTVSLTARAFERYTRWAGTDTNKKELQGDLSATGDLDCAGGYRQTFDGWYQANVPANQSAVALGRMGGAWDSLIVPRAGSLTAICVRSNEARTAGTLTVEICKNSVATGLTAVLNGTDTQFKSTTQAKDTDTFVAGDLIDVKITTDASWAPTTADIRVTIELET